MNFELNEEQRQLRDSIRRWIEKDHGFEARRTRLRSGQPCDSRHWALFAQQGWLAAALPEETGGLGGGLVETLVIANEFGRGLVVEPYLASAVLAAQTLFAADAPAQHSLWGPRLAEGTSRLALAYAEAAARGAPEPVVTTAVPQGSGWRLQGLKSLVLGGADADAFIVSARVTGQPGLELFLVDAASPGLSRTALPLHDGSWAAELKLEAVDLAADALLGRPGTGLQALRLGLAHGTFALCADLVGGMERAIELTADYLKMRKQFGVAIGSFQALQHRMADMAAELELSRSMLFELGSAIRCGDCEVIEDTVSQAKAYVSRAARWVCSQAIQLHGGIGMTDEFIVGHYFKRAVVADVLFGNADLHDARSAARLQARLAPLTPIQETA